MKTVSREFVSELIDFAPTDEARRRGYAEGQLDGTVALFNMLARNRVAYLADEVGMGKTYVALGVMSLLRYLEPRARVVVIAPRENIQRKWIKELQNFVRSNWKVQDNRVKSLQGTPAWEPVLCDSLFEFAREALLHADRDFFLRSTSFSLALKQPESRRKLRRELRELVPWVEGDGLSARTPELFRDAFAAAINAAVPDADLVIVDEGHNLKHGFGPGVATRNRVLGLAFGHPEGNTLAGEWYRHRAKRVLFLSATPFEDDYAAIQRQLEVLGFGDAQLADDQGASRISVRELLDAGAEEQTKREIVGRLMLRRASGLRIGGELYTKNMYRREWRMGGYARHDEPMHIDDPRQRLIVALMQKKVAEVLQHERFNSSFQIGMLSSFESFLESLSRSKRLAARAASLAKGQEEVDDAEEEAGERVFDGDQAVDPTERKGIDSDAIARIADSYREQFGASLPHPKLDVTAEALADAFDTGEKALVFVRRVRTVAELGAKLDRYYDLALRRRMLSALPSLTDQVEQLFARYEQERRSGASGASVVDEVDTGEAEPLEQMEARGFVEDGDEGGNETFFSWFFRGNGPSGVLSGAAFQKNRLSGESSTYSTLFEEDYVGWLLGRPDDVMSVLADRMGQPLDTMVRALGALAFAQFGELSHRASGYPRRIAFECYQIAGLRLLAGRDGELGQQAEIVLHERFGASRIEPIDPPQGFPGPEVALGIPTFITNLVRRPALRARIWPEETAGDFRTRFRRSEQRRELLSALARLGAAYVDLYLLAIAQLGSFEHGSTGDGESAAAALADAYLDLLEHQMSEPGFHAFHELAGAAETFDLLVSANFPDAPNAPLHELAGLYGATLQRQVPVGRMSGGVNKRLVRQFRMPGYPVVLVTTDVLQEGEDLHTFCRRIVHYGISWTPSAMEQRTGRIDRIGGLVQRDLDGIDVVPEADRFIQVFYPHLRDTVEVLQVQRVLRRLNRFLTLIHERGHEPREVDSRIDMAREVLTEIESIAPIQGRLESAFPLRAGWLDGELGAGNVARPDVEAQVAQLEDVWQTLRLKWQIVPVGGGGRLEHRGRAGLRRGRLALLDESSTDEQDFVLSLRSQAAGDATLLRCRSLVGMLRLSDDETLDALYDLQIELGHPRICIEPHVRLHAEEVSIHHDILFHRDATQIQDVVAMIERTVCAAKRIRDELLPVEEEDPKSRRRGRRAR